MPGDINILVLQIFKLTWWVPTTVQEITFMQASICVCVCVCVCVRVRVRACACMCVSARLPQAIKNHSLEMNPE